MESRLVNYKLTEADERAVLNAFKDPLTVQTFIGFLQSVVKHNKAHMEKSAKAYLLTDDPQARSMALITEGKIQVLDELCLMIERLNK